MVLEPCAFGPLGGVQQSQCRAFATVLRSPPVHTLVRLSVLAMCGGSDLPSGGGDTQIVDDQEKNDWITFFKRTHHMTEEEVETQIKTPAVLRDFESVKLSNLPDEVRVFY